MDRDGRWTTAGGYGYAPLLNQYRILLGNPWIRSVQLNGVDNYTLTTP
ncbi:MAG: hypothetical protein K8H88_13835 [Sandaracinaceae bacterium]|nr:hypothetical protein [Sandaracinaceae bacterium]